MTLWVAVICVVGAGVLSLINWVGDLRTAKSIRDKVEKPIRIRGPEMADGTAYHGCILFLGERWKAVIDWYGTGEKYGREHDSEWFDTEQEAVKWTRRQLKDLEIGD